jgi:type IV secretion system protein TrbE
MKMKVREFLFPKYKPTRSYFMSGMTVHDDLDSRGSVTKSFLIETPDLRSASNNLRNKFHDDINSLLRTFYQSTDKIHLQIQWSVNSSFYSSYIDDYEADTKMYAKKEIVIRSRNERSARYRKKIENRELRYEQCIIHVSFKLRTNVPSGLNDEELLEHYEGILANKQLSFDKIYQNLCTGLGGSNIKITAMGDRENFFNLFEYFNPGMQNRNVNPEAIYKKLILKESHIRKTENPEYCWQHETVQELCCRSGIRGNERRTESSEYGFILDGCYNDILVIKEWGDITFPCQFYELTSQPFLDYSITVNIYPKDKARERRKLTDDISRLERESVADSKNYTHGVSIATKKQRLDNQSMGISYPFEVHYIIRVWDVDKNRLVRKVGDIKSGIENLSGATYYEFGNPATQRQFFHIAMPTWLFNNKKSYRINAENHYLCDRLPLSSTYTGLLENAEAIYDGSMFNLVGYKGFINGTPQMLCTFGMQSSGKSLFFIDMIAQTACFYDYTCIIEEGNSYGTIVKLLGEETLVVNPSGDFTINYFDTNGMPVDTNQIAFCSSLLTQMCGQNSDMDKMIMRNSMLNYYVQLTYTHRFDYWSRHNESLIPEIARISISAAIYRKKYLPSSASAIEGWMEFRDLFAVNDDKACAIYNAVTEDDITDYRVSEKTTLRNNAHAWYKPEDFPTHSDLCSCVDINRNTDQHSEDEIKMIITLLSSWKANEGIAGKIFDGVTNIRLDRKIAHFELGSIPESSGSLKTVVAFLINNCSRNYILKLPRGSKKRIIFEEAGRFLDIPGGETIISECFAQMRKFNCQPITIIQQYEKFKHSKIRSTIVGNAKQFVMLRAKDRGDINDMAKDIYMPEALRDGLTKYPTPEQAGFSCFTYHHDSTPNPIYGTVKNEVSKEIIFIGSTKGEDVENREREFKKHEGSLMDVVDKIVQNKSLEVCEIKGSAA